MCKKLVESEPRKKLLVQIKEHPGIIHRQLLRLTGLSNGQMSFHLKKLTTSKLVRIKKFGYNTTRYYPMSVKTVEADILDHIDGSTRRKIILFLLQHSDSRFREIVQYIEKAGSTTSSHLRRLEHAGIISVKRVDKKNQFYRLKNKSKIIKIILKYKISQTSGRY